MSRERDAWASGHLRSSTRGTSWSAREHVSSRWGHEASRERHAWASVRLLSATRRTWWSTRDRGSPGVGHEMSRGLHAWTSGHLRISMRGTSSSARDLGSSGVRHAGSREDYASATQGTGWARRASRTPREETEVSTRALVTCSNAGARTWAEVTGCQRENRGARGDGRGRPGPDACHRREDPSQREVGECRHRASGSSPESPSVSPRSPRKVRRPPSGPPRSCLEMRWSRRVPSLSRRLSRRSAPVSPAGSREGGSRASLRPRRCREMQRSLRATARCEVATRAGRHVSLRSRRQAKPPVPDGPKR